MKYSVLFILLCGVLCLVACKEKTQFDDIIEKEKFIEVLTDIHMTDATMIVKGFRINIDSVRVRKYYNDILIEYNVTQKQIHNTFSYYTQNPRKFEKVYEEVSANIAKLEKEHFEKAENAKNERKKNALKGKQHDGMNKES